jgi:Asp-tRNA(Asn)/Glu-tRNA(Gln) amidotransferase A subunit family amidase
MLPIADGSDLDGSLRNPANFNNVVALRPFGRPGADGPTCFRASASASTGRWHARSPTWPFSSA